LSQEIWKKEGWMEGEKLPPPLLKPPPGNNLFFNRFAGSFQFNVTLIRIFKHLIVIQLIQ